MGLFKKMLFCGFFCLPFIALGQEQNGNGELRVFLDCNYGCDLNYIRMEVKFCDFVRDRFLANVYMLMTTQGTGGGGDEVKLYFSGQENFTGLKDTITFNRNVNTTDDEFRQDLIKYIQLGLVPYILRTSNAKDFSLQKPATSATDTSANKVVADPWNFWVFRTGLNGNFNGDNNYTSARVNVNASASRTTEKLKASSFIYYSQNKNTYTYEIDEGVDTTIKVVNPSYGISGDLVFSLNKHWSAGAFASASHSVFSNYDLTTNFNAAIEYDVFPYVQSNQKLWTFSYQVGALYNRYLELTLYDKLEELRFQQNLSTSVSLVQKWGNVDFSLGANSFLDNFSQNSVYGNIYFDVRLFKGFSVNCSLFASSINNQLNITKDGASSEEVLARIKQLATSYNYYVYFGANYTFGSIYNNVVNPRFNSGGNNFFF